ncbi:MAG TPA: hypothetical protein VMX17_07640 [Candidatus Glassbacteria bacterium]|nr:hypothetical protein [Candidatus Glassbacteria bacterium]
MKKTIKVVINNSFGGFGLSKKAILRMRELGSDWAKRVLFKGDKHPWYNHINNMSDGNYYMAASSSEKDIWEDIERDDPVLVLVVEELGSTEASGFSAKLEVETINYELEIENYYDGKERAKIISY